MNEDAEGSDVVESPLSKEVTRDGVTVQIDIYGDGEGKWILEIVDDQNTSHVWEELFETNQLALDEAIRTMDEEGMDAFTGADG